jgi:hypothetical protein
LLIDIQFFLFDELPSIANKQFVGQWNASFAATEMSCFRADYGCMKFPSAF